MRHREKDACCNSNGRYNNNDYTHIMDNKLDCFPGIFSFPPILLFFRLNKLRYPSNTMRSLLEQNASLYFMARQHSTEMMNNTTKNYFSGQNLEEKNLISLLVSPVYCLCPDREREREK